MSTVTGSAATYPDSFDAPDDGDDLDAASVNVGLTALADRTAFIHTGAIWVPLDFASSSTRFTADDSTRVGRFWEQTDVTDVGLLGIFKVPSNQNHKASLLYLDVMWGHTATTHVALPTTMPNVALGSRDRIATPEATTWGTTIINAGLDAADTGAPADVTAYEAGGMATFNITADTYYLTDDLQYFVEIKGEAGTNKLTGWRLYGVRLRVGAAS